MDEPMSPGLPGAQAPAAGQGAAAGQQGSQAPDAQAAQAQGMAQAQAAGAPAPQGSQGQQGTQAQAGAGAYAQAGSQPPAAGQGNAPGQQGTNPGQPGQGQPAPVQLSPEQAQDFAPDWKAALPEALRKEAEAFASADEMKEALKRGAAYRPALDPADLDVKPEGVDVDPEANRKFRELGVKIGLTREQAAALMDFEAKTVSAAVRREQEEGVARLRTQWADKYDANVARAERALMALDSRMGGRLAAAFGKGGLASSPVLLEAFAHVGEGMAEDSAPAKAAAASPRETPLATYERMFH